MANILHLDVDNPEEILLAGHSGTGAVIQIQSCATETGTYADVDTVAVVAGTLTYTYAHSAGDSSTWYRTRYETSGGVATSDWSAPFQVGDDAGGMICSLRDVTDRLFGTATPSSSESEILTEIIREVGSSLEHATGRWLIPRPSSGTTTYRLHTNAGSVLRVPRGIRSITTLKVASSDQPDTGGTYTTMAAADYYLHPPTMDRDVGWPATSIRLINGTQFYSATHGAEITGAFGFAETPPDIRGVAIEAVTRRYIGKETAAPAISVGPAGGIRLLASLSPDSRAIVDSYRYRLV